MFIGVDLSSNMVSFSYLHNDTIKTCYMKEVSEFYYSKINSERLNDLLKGIKMYAEFMLQKPIVHFVIAIPSYCDYLHIKKLYNLSNNLGIDILDVQYSSSFSCMCLGHELYLEKQGNKRPGHVNLYCSLHPDRIEFTVFEHSDGITELLGTTTVMINKNQETDTIKKQIHSEINQLTKDLNLTTRISKETYMFYSDLGCDHNLKEYVIDLSKSSFGVEPISYSSCCASRGALLQAMILHGKLKQSLVLNTQNRSISIGLGENGEFKNMIRYYSTIPIKKTEDLLVSNEKRLLLYEGNYLNRKFDTVIGEFKIPDHLEGHTIKVELLIDVRHKISISVTDDRNNVVLPRTIV